MELLLAEIRLREQMQLEEHLQATESRSLQSKASNNGTEPPQYNEKLEQVRKQIGFYMLDLYRCESMLPLRSLRQVYDKLRKNPKWFLRKDLVDDCIRKGGCCTRGCRCCEKRHMGNETRKGIGHCTVECGCCVINRRCEFTQEEKKELADKTVAMLKNLQNPSYLSTMLEAFFSELKPSELVSQKQASKGRRLGIFKR